ncbi:RlpA-like double-psi beta-barrel domain [Pseudocohnilembus persalinus]|uniref:RlpA-like double-psi beta-barrel domain n=1 Tax=Pseudocohnilembus persalinus TaxID=266149 RepID=A0A0V0QE70_PSEPJ|nr:RlpA-like double-psi beta-barrel domain [Pseudocohnilembus persalinus]|eukprot:KRX00501.1 RlpA-like double-psi beta-barrel domain [Pseudocohnilembus persalinus]
MNMIKEKLIFMIAVTSILAGELPDNLTWYDGKGTIYWDCSGMACDSPRVPNEWTNGKNPYYIARSYYAPKQVDDSESVYGESLWATMAASDNLGNLLGNNADNYQGINDHTGCGKCVLMKVPSATNSETIALVMKTNRCPPWSNGCSNSDPYHIDLAVPGFDALSYSTANICGTNNINGVSVDTCFNDQQSSGQCFDNNYNPINNCQCEIRGPRLQNGCKQFTNWGWQTGNPDIKFAIVDCPTSFIEYISQADPNSYNTCGTDTQDQDNDQDEQDQNNDQDNDSDNDIDIDEDNNDNDEDQDQDDNEQTNEEDQDESDEDNSNDNDDDNENGNDADSSKINEGNCYINECGCPIGFKQNWCQNNYISLTQSHECQQSEDKCVNCNSIWCQNQDQNSDQEEQTEDEQSDDENFENDVIVNEKGQIVQGVCYILECGCPSQFKQSWCENNQISLTQSLQCQSIKDMCIKNCNSVWCDSNIQDGENSSDIKKSFILLMMIILISFQ